jgi:predicted MFS family arabinose efflux permease
MARLVLGQTFRILGYISAAVLLPSIMVWKPQSGTTAKHSLARGNLKPFLLDFSLLKDSRFIALLVTTTVAMIGFLPRYFLLPQSVVSQGISVTYASWLLGLMNGLSIAGRIGIGWLADRYGKVTALASSFILADQATFPSGCQVC